MFRKLFGGGSQRIDFLFAALFGKAFYRNHLRRTIGERPRLVKRNLLHAGQAFQSVPFADQETVLCRIPNRRHDCGGRGQDQCAGAEYDKDCNSTDRLARENPCEGGGSQCNHDDPGSPSVRHPDDFCFPRVCGLDKANHALYGTVPARFCRFHFKGAKLI